MKEYLPYGHQSLGAEEARRMAEVLESDWLTQGPKVVEFENGLNRLCNSRHAVAVSHGTTALYLACRAAGLGPGDRFLTSPIAFLATANAGLLCGAEPVFADIDPDTFNLDPNEVGRILKKDRRIKVVLPVHLGGHVCAMDQLAECCDEIGAIIVEDARHAIGGRWQDQAGSWHSVGDGAYSALTCFSFHPLKNVTSGEGGAVTTNSDELADRLRLLRNHGITRDPQQMRSGRDPWHYEMHELSVNGRLTDFQAAMGLVQIEKLPRLKRRRQELVRRYDEAFADLEGVTTQSRPDDDDICWNLMIVRARGRTALYEHLLAKGIRTQVHYVPIHTQPYYQDHFDTRPGDYPVAEKYYAQALTLPLYPDLSDEEQDRVIAAVRAFYRADEAQDRD